MTKSNNDEEAENTEYLRQKEKIRNLKKKSEYEKRQKAIVRRKKIRKFVNNNFNRTKEFTTKTSNSI
jgi:hypothetical protein